MYGVIGGEMLHMFSNDHTISLTTTEMVYFYVVADFPGRDELPEAAWVPYHIEIVYSTDNYMKARDKAKAVKENRSLQSESEKDLQQGDRSRRPSKRYHQIEPGLISKRKHQRAEQIIVDSLPEIQQRAEQITVDSLTETMSQPTEPLINCRSSAIEQITGTIGGIDFQTSTRRVMTTIFTNELAIKLNWVGHGGKMVFQSLKLSQVLCDAVRRGGTNPVPQDSVIENVAKLWLQF
ncbi:hypothetical protein MATL_G00192030 [Megalops atlanticus]|uniref:DUF4806 domain-containing protein n=1 Tax=Megalops atlanticus TaxID=7932 RepID=A0A9D3SYC0_MEGAT|nr:hypothetical protein MATL_G00192030 [Megalops atlanticus]